MKIVDYKNWKGDMKVNYVRCWIESVMGHKEYLFTPKELINARARWLNE